jgi:hypothetical protein
MSRAFLILALLASLTPQVRSAEKPVKIYIFAGQSNMEARYPRAFIEEKHPELLADKKIWNVQVGWPSRPIQESPAFGVDRAMVYKIAQETGQEIIVLRCAVGGTVLHTQWRPPSAVKRAGGTVGPLYMSLVNRFHNLVAHLEEFYPPYRGQGYEIAGFVWFQGESDSCSHSEVDDEKVGNWNYYEANLRDLIHDVRRDFGVPEMPVLIPQINVSDPWEMNKVTIVGEDGTTTQTTSGQIIRDIQRKVAESTPHCTWVETLGMTRLYHYDAPSYIEIGRRMGDAMMPFAKKPPAVTDEEAIQRARRDFYNRVCPDMKPDVRRLAQGLIAYLPFDEGEGLTVIGSSSHKLKGELVATRDGEYVPLWVDGIHGKALKFMASNYVKVPDFSDPIGPDGKIDRISMSYWINKTGHCGYGGHLARRSADRKLGWWIDESHNTNKPEIHFAMEEGPYSEVARARTIGDGYEWHHIAIVFDGPSQRFDYYFDGRKMPRYNAAIEVDGKRTVVVKRPTTWKIYPANREVALRIGEQGWFGTMTGPSEAQTIDEVAIWNRALTDTEITSLYNNGRGVKLPKNSP